MGWGLPVLAVVTYSSPVIFIQLDTARVTERAWSAGWYGLGEMRPATRFIKQVMSSNIMFKTLFPQGIIFRTYLESGSCCR